MKKSTFIIVGIIVSVLLFGGAAFVGARLLNWQISPGSRLDLFPDNGSGQRIQISRDDIQPAKELPQTAADVWGLFDHRQDNIVFVGTGSISVDTRKDKSGNVETASDYDGPIVAIVVTTQTTLYEDVTMQQFNGSPADGQNMQQVVEPGSLDGLGEFSTIAVWGRKTGDRLIADVLVYEFPAFIKKRVKPMVLTAARNELLFVLIGGMK